MKLIAEERLDAAKGHTEGPWRIDHSKCCGADTPTSFVYANTDDGVAKVRDPRDLAAIALAPELLAENEMLRALLTEAINVNADIAAHAHHMCGEKGPWRAEKIMEAADALMRKLDEVLP